MSVCAKTSLILADSMVHLVEHIGAQTVFETDGVSFEREFDEDTGFYEIMVRRNG
jgi:hypothetical protein